jgi:hypothetical protein
MKHNLVPLNDRIEELLSLLVTEGLSTEEQTEFDQIDWHSLGTSADVEIAGFEQAAAAFAIAFDELGGHEEPLPIELRNRLEQDARKFFAGNGADTLSVDPKEVDRRTIQPASLMPRVTAPPSWREALAILAAAACLAMLLFNWYAGRPVQTSPDVRMAMLIKASPADLVTADWAPVQDQNTRGKVVWSDSRQEGYMVFDGLPANDPAREQYQLWIFDTDANQAYPVDGGVFDIRGEGKVTIPIAPRIPVDKAVMFAVTIEKPGGVVVSTRERLPVLAKVESGK